MEIIERVCLDTDILIDELRGFKPTIDRIRGLESSGKIILATTSINAFELYYGAMKTRKRESNREAVERLLSRLLVFDFDERAAEKAAEIMAHLEAEGRPIDFRDAFIGATVMMNESILFTGNTAHFERIPGITLGTGTSS